MAGLNPEALRKAAAAKSKASAAVKAVSAPPTAQGAKATSKEILKGATKGAATGGAAGAARGAVVALAKTSAGRKIITVLAVVAIAIAAIVPMGMFMMLMSTSATADAGDMKRSGESVVAGNKTLDEATDALNKVSNANVPWEIYLALTDVQKPDEIDIKKLGKALGEGSVATIGAGAVYVDGQGLAPGKSDAEKDLAQREQDHYVSSLVDYGLEESQAKKVYSTALAWRLGQASTCTSVETSQAPMEFDLPEGKHTSLSEVQTSNAAKIINAARKIDGMTDDAIIVALMAAMTESSLQNYANSGAPESLTYPHDAVGSDHDSLGFWQMRAGWGSVKDRMDIAYQTRAFFGGPDGPNHGSPRGLFDIPDWESKTRGQAAQAVEVSAFPDRYAANESLAEELLRRFGSGQACNGGVGLAGDAGHPLGDPSFVIVSGFGGRKSPGGIGSTDHKGIDFKAACNTPIYAIADGDVISSGPSGGWGNSVVIDHGNVLRTRSAHMPNGANWPAAGTHVTKGQQIGVVGSTGNSTGCHLHFETVVDGKALDPYIVLTQMGVELRWKGE